MAYLQYDPRTPTNTKADIARNMKRDVESSVLSVDPHARRAYAAHQPVELDHESRDPIHTDWILG